MSASKILGIVIGCALLGLVSCDDSPTGTGGSGAGGPTFEGTLWPHSQSGEYFPIDSSLAIAVLNDITHENGTGANGFVILLLTDKIYGCYNYELPSEVNVRGNRIEIRPKGMWVPSLCADALGPANTAFRFSSGPGRFHFTVSLDRRRTEFVVIKTEDELAISGPDVGWIHCWER